MSGMLGARAQKVLKWIHVTVVAFSLGGVLSMLVLVLLKNQLNLDQNLFLIDLSIYQLFNVVVNYSFYAVIVTGIIYSLFSKWGFFKHHWITVKWIGVVFAFVFVWFWLGPMINGMAALADGGFVLPGTRSEYLGYVGQSQIFIFILGIVFLSMAFISVYKPWGVRKRQVKIKRAVVLIVVGIIVLFLISGLVMQSIMIHNYRTMEIADSKLTSLADGTYEGEAEDGAFTYRVEVVVLELAIKDLKVTANRTSPYARFAEAVIPRIIAAQNANVDAITGATTTSKVLMKAVENALKIEP
jgi:uncharacterized protein with FMN-binding domain